MPVIARPSGGTPDGILEKLDTFQRQVVAALKELITFTRDKRGFVPAPGGTGITRFLCEDGTWRIP